MDTGVGIWPEIIQGDAREVLKTLPAESVHCVVTSPPYWGLRDYGVSGQIGLEPTPEQHVEVLVEVFQEVKRILRPDATCWLNYGDCYACAPNGRKAADIMGDDRTFRDKPFSTVTSRASSPKHAKGMTTPVAERQMIGLKPKDLVGMPWRVAFALQAAGWWLRSAITICKNNPMPESVSDRPTSATEMLFLLTKAERYFYDSDAIREPHTEARNWPTWEERKAGGAAMRRGDTGQSGDVCHWAGVGGNPNGRNKRNWWLINSQPLKDMHFATFPEALVEPCILAGTSERGCCPECGAGWRRVVEKEYHSPPQYKQAAETTLTEGRNRNVTRMGDGVSVQTTGWKPTCSHIHPESALVPAVVLDPFFGSGTVGKAATNLGRKSIGIDLQPDYLAIARKRTSQGGLGL